MYNKTYFISNAQPNKQHLQKIFFFDLTGCDVIFEEIGSFFGFKVTDKCIRQKK